MAVAPVRRPRPRSLRFRVLWVVVVVAVAPLVYVWLTNVADATVEQRMRIAIGLAAHDAASVVARGGASARLDAVARRYAVRLRLLDPSGAVLGDVDHESSTWSKRLGDLVFEEDGAPTLRDYDATLPPFAERPDFAAALRDGQVASCDTNPGRTLLVCQALRTATLPGGAQRVVSVEQSSRRSIRALYDARYQLLKLTLFGLVLATLLGWWLGRRIVHPIEDLRAAVLDRVDTPLAATPLRTTRRDEIGDLSGAFDTLLAEVAARSRANEGFVADLAHEMKNPIAAIRAVSERLDGASDPARAERLVRILADSTTRLDALVTGLLELARAEGGLPGEAREPVDGAALLGGLLDTLRADPRWTVTFALDAEPAWVDAVPGRLEAALRNLLLNAASFAERTVAVRVTGGPTVRIAVSDDGPGLAPEDRDHVFDRFFTRRAEGTGLGLPLARAVVEAHGGQIDVASTPGAGATFTVTLPAAST